MKRALVFFVSLLALAACNNSNIQQHQLSGYAQGTTFQVKYIASPQADFATAIDSIFAAVDQSVSTYNPNSLIIALNKADSSFKPDQVFKTIWQRAFGIAEETKGSFDPTVGPLVQLWGFGPQQKKEVDSTLVDSVLKFTAYQKVQYSTNSIVLPVGFSIDFNAIAQGYTVDLIAQYLESKGVTHYMVEVGGEVKARGENIDGKVWRIGIDKPTEEIDEANRFQVIVALENAALATSGNYRKFWVDEESGIKYSHTINPQTGYPARNRLLSASVISTNSCMDADAYATACMVMGTPKAIQFIESKNDLEAYLIYSNEDGEWETYISKGFETYIQ